MLNVLLLDFILLNVSLMYAYVLNVILFSIWAPKTTSYVLVIKLFYFVSHPITKVVSVKILVSPFCLVQYLRLTLQPT
jgi:hypothetical protein